MFTRKFIKSLLEHFAQNEDLGDENYTSGTAIVRLKQFSGGPSFWIANQLVEGDFNFKSNHTMIEGVRRIYFK